MTAGVAMIYCYDCRFENRVTPCLDAGGRRDFDKLATAYIDELRARQVTGARPVDAWAWGCVNALQHADPRSTLFFVLVTLDRLDLATRHCLAVLAAGPLETILDHFADEIIAAVELIGRRSAKFRLLLAAVGETRIKPHVLTRIRAVLSPVPLNSDHHRSPGDRVGTVASECEVLALLGTSVLDDLGGRAEAAALIGLD